MYDKKAFFGYFLVAFVIFNVAFPLLFNWIFVGLLNTGLNIGFLAPISIIFGVIVGIIFARNKSRK
jgi:NADH:ubiquinone oxidoreductase subunit 3 (subunit A)